MEKVKNQHYVPRSYLKYFANKKGQIWVYDKQTDKKFISNIEGIASERFFYDVPFDQIMNSMLKIDSISKEEKEEMKKILEETGYLTSEEAKHSMEQSVEKFFSEKIEGNFKQLLDKIRSRYTMMPSPLLSEALSDEERVHLSVLLAFQIVRSKEFREAYSETKKATTQSIVDILAASHDDSYELGSLTYAPQYESKPLEHAQLIYSDFPFQLAEVLASHIWFIGVNQTSMPFYTSDNPVVKHAHKKDPFLGTDGYGSPGIEIAIPLSSKLILVLVEKTYHHDLIQGDRLYMPITSEEYVIYYNSLQVFQSHRQVYCHDNSFDLISEMKKNEGSLARKPKKMIVNSFLGENIY